MQIHSPETASSVSSIFRSEPVLQSMLCFCWTSGIVYLLGAERLQPELLSELLSGPCDSSGLLDWGFLGSFLAHLLTSSCGFRFRDPTRRGICPVLLKLILSLFRTYSAYACLLTAHCSWVSHDPCTPTYEQSFLLIITHHYSSWSICSLLYASLLGAAVWPMRQLWPSRLRFPRQFPGSPAHLKLRFPFQRPNTERHLPSLA